MTTHPNMGTSRMMEVQRRCSDSTWSARSLPEQNCCSIHRVTVGGGGYFRDVNSLSPRCKSFVLRDGISATMRIVIWSAGLDLRKHWRAAGDTLEMRVLHQLG